MNALEAREDGLAAGSDSTQKAAMRLARSIVRTIQEEGLQPGDRYLSEADALKRHGVARATFREALRFLELQGVLTVRAGPKGGAVVARPSWPSLASTLALLMQFENAPLRQVLEARSVIEPGMAPMVVEHATDAEVAAMGAAIVAAEAAMGDYPAFSHHYHRFWALFAQGTHNAVLAMLSPALRAIVDSGGFVPDEVQRGLLVERLRGLHDRVEARDADGARAKLAEIEDAFLDRLRTGYPQRIAQTVAWADVGAEESPLPGGEGIPVRTRRAQSDDVASRDN
ncbi:FadR/GntR family transcriptional regulator [Flavisphingomonas formosensis]|uniref:FadR/GntR family transcriptional regulator n=1 Tax=Flavisphingomonas formosensis TaxID=861534 RepID=UPI0012F7A3A6|nr:FCD domain-containing protein [Sphingomonas formosensis]